MSMSMDELMKMHVENNKKIQEEEKQKQSQMQKITYIQPKHKYDSPYAMENSTATFLYIVTMIIGTLFQDRILVYVAATVIWWKYITRHKEK